MKVRFPNSEERSELAALVTVVAVLTAGTAAKLGVAVQLFHLAHWP